MMVNKCFLLCISLMIIFGGNVTLSAQTDDIVRLAYLKSDENGVAQIFITDPNNLESRQQITDVSGGVSDFDISTDGQFIAYSARDDRQMVADIYLLELATNEVRKLTDCSASSDSCFNPVFSPLGDKIAFVYQDTPSIALETTLIYIWLIDLTENTVAPLSDDEPIFGIKPVWSPDGEHLAFFDLADSNVTVYTFADESFRFFPSAIPEDIIFSPDATQIAYLAMIYDEDVHNAPYTEIWLTTIADGTRHPVGRTDPNHRNGFMAWRPNSTQIALSQGYLENGDETFGRQIYLYDTQTNILSPLVVNKQYESHFFTWDMTGEYLAMQRWQVLGNNGLSISGPLLEVWIYEMSTARLIKIDDDARNPQWLP
ncbi:MAG: hypothetical protein SFZ02_07735 [bacterium]|nr:hypothetical protein [bacterium]